jgi:anti-sigma B factor antagonist
MLSQRPSVSYWAEVAIEQQTALLSLFGELGSLTVASFDRRLQSLEARVHHVVVDLRGLTIINAMGVSVLMQAAARAEREVWRLSVVRGPEAVDALFRLPAIGSRISLFDDLQDLFPPPALVPR